MFLRKLPGRRRAVVVRPQQCSKRVASVTDSAKYVNVAHRELNAFELGTAPASPRAAFTRGAAGAPREQGWELAWGCRVAGGQPVSLGTGGDLDRAGGRGMR